MRVAIVDTYYAAFLERHYARSPELAAADYTEQHAALMAASFGTGDAYSHGLRALGHEATEIIVNCRPMQSAWAREHDLPGAADPVTIALAQVEELRADVVYLQDLLALPQRRLARLRRAGVLVAGQIASPLPLRRRLRAFDLLVSSLPNLVARFEALGIDAEYLPIAFDERILGRLAARGVDAGPQTDRPYAVSFVGSLSPRLHGRGTAALEAAAGEIHALQVWGYGADELAGGSILRERYRGEAWALEMYEILARSQISLNRHIDIAGGHANNMRLFEATGLGGALLTDAGTGLGELFAIGEEVAAYRDADDLVAQTRALLADGDRRRALATAGRARTMRDHTYRTRIPQLATMLAARLG